MKEIKIGYSETVADVEELLKYYAGKRAAGKDAYFRFVACGADKGMLLRLLEGACGDVVLMLHPFCEGFSVSLDEIGFTTGAPESLSPGMERSLQAALKTLLVRRVMRQWLLLSGATGFTETDAEEGRVSVWIGELMRANTTRLMKPMSRSFPPF